MLSAITLALLSITPVLAVEWHVLGYNTAPSQQFTSFSGDMTVPPLPRPGTYYLWPGLQPADNSGVLQPVLDGRSGSWYIGTGWCCSNPSLPWGGGFGVTEGDVVRFNMTKNAAENAWDTRLTVFEKGLDVNGSLALADKDFNVAVFAIELYDVPWDFGQLKFENVVLTADGTDTGFCNGPAYSLYDSTNYSGGNGEATVGPDGVSCRIDSVVLESPK